jgi:putative oxidoreductase
MKNLGIDFFPTFWGLMAASTEAIGGLLLIIGLFFRPACFFLLFTMGVAASSYFFTGGTLKDAAHPIEIGFSFLGMFILGPGKYSIDKS